MKSILAIVIWGYICTLGVPQQKENNTSVYICTGKSAYSYHNNRDCRGLNKCNAEIKSVSLEYAKSIGRSPCKICY